MPDPINYGAMQPTVDITKAFGGGFEMANAIKEAQLAQAIKQQALDNTANMEKDVRTVFGNPNAGAKDYAGLSLKYPQLADKFKQSWGMIDDAQKDEQLKTYSRVNAAALTGNNDVAAQILQESADAAKNSGDEEKYKHDQQFADMFRDHPDQAKNLSNLALASIMGPDKYASTFSTLGGETRAQDLAPVDLNTKQSEATIKSVQANNAAPLAEAELGTKQAESKIKGAEAANIDTKLGLENNKTAAETFKATHPDAPSGYQWMPDGSLHFIKGGAADPDSKIGAPMGNRESVFVARVLNAANESSKDLANIVRLPMTSSRGIFGGRQQGGSLLAAGKEALTNQMTTQEVQSYNVLSSGIQRNLAAIEAAGLAPSGTLSHQMDAVTYKEGDTNFTKLQKLAQTKQIVNAGLETTLANPRLPDKQRQHVQNILDSINKSVPFDNGDLIDLQAMQEVDPKISIGDVVNIKAIAAEKNWPLDHAKAFYQSLPESTRKALFK